MIHRRGILLLGCLLFLVACAQASDGTTTIQTESQLPTAVPSRPVAQATPVREAVDTPTPRARPTPTLVSGTAGLSAVLYSETTDTPLAGTVFYLTPGRGPEQRDPPVIYTGADTEAGDIVEKTGSEGEIMINGVAPGNYYLVVWAPYDWLLANDPGADMPRLIELSAGEWHDLGRLDTPWP